MSLGRTSGEIFASSTMNWRTSSATLSTSDQTTNRTFKMNKTLCVDGPGGHPDVEERNGKGGRR